MTAEKTSPAGKRFAFSYRPPGSYEMKDGKYVLDGNGKRVFKPNFVGGAVYVVAASGVDAWIAHGAVLPRADYEKLSEEEKFPTKPLIFPCPNGKSMELYLYPIPVDDKDRHYNYANTVLWPVHHEIPPYDFMHPVETTHSVPDEKTRYTFHMTKAELEESFQHYLDFNHERGNHYLKVLENAGVIKRSRGDKLDCHDYQNANVGADMFIFHIPIPSLEYLKKIEVPVGNGTTEPFLARGGVMQRYLDSIIDNHETINCQRAGDQSNLLKLIEYFHPEVAVDNKAYTFSNYENENAPEQQFISKPVALHLRDARTGASRELRIMNHPVGTSQEDNLKEAKLYESYFNPDVIPPVGAAVAKEKIYKAEKLQETGVSVEEGKPATTANILRHVLQPGGGFMFNVHRDDPSKKALAQIEAAKILYRERPDAMFEMPFVLFASRTRPDIAAYDHYHDAVIDSANEVNSTHGAAALRKKLNDPNSGLSPEIIESIRDGKRKFGNAFIIVTDEIPHGELMALERHRNMWIKLEGAIRDGHALTGREPADARADWTDEQLEAHPPAVIMPDGIGASDVLRGTQRNPGAIIFESNSDPEQYIQNMARAMIQAYDLRKSKEGRKELASRYRVMSTASAKYTGLHFGDMVHQASDQAPREYPESMIHAVGRVHHPEAFRPRNDPIFASGTPGAKANGHAHPGPEGTASMTERVDASRVPGAPPSHLRT